MSPKNRGLGRGLNALFEDEETTAPSSSPAAQANPNPDSQSTNGRRLIGIDQISPGRFQPRTMFNDESLGELAESIKTHGLLQPIIVRALKDEAGKYEIIAGERRWRAAQKAQLHEIPTVVMELTDEEAMEIALVENLQREDLNPVDEAMGYKKLMEQFGHTQEKLAAILGKSRSYIANMIRLLVLPDEVLYFLECGDISIGHARALITARDATTLAKEIMAKNLSVRETENLVTRETGRGKKVAPGAGVNMDANTRALEHDIANALGMRVSIESSDDKSGKITVFFKTLDQLDEVIKKLVFARMSS